MNVPSADLLCIQVITIFIVFSHFEIFLAYILIDENQQNPTPPHLNIPICYVDYQDIRKVI